MFIWEHDEFGGENEKSAVICEATLAEKSNTTIYLYIMNENNE